MDLNEFAKDIRQVLLANIPIESKVEFDKKHAKYRSEQLYQALGKDSNFVVIPLGTNGYVFEMGSDNLEATQPHYHILEDAYTIKKKGQGTATSKGSQDKVSNLSSRDYGKWTVRINEPRTITRNGKKVSLQRSVSVYQEYRKNVRGGRKPKQKIIEKVNKRTGEVITKDVSSSYINKHYHYIEKTFDSYLPIIAQKYGMRMGRVSINNEEADAAANEFLSDFANY